MSDERRALILASTSPYRKALLQRLHLPFIQVAPDFAEQTVAADSIEALVEHNTVGKAQSVLEQYPDASVIASDQIALFEGEAVGKPGTARHAMAQLARFSGRAVDFLTGIAFCSACGQHFDIVTTRVHFRQLSEQEIADYVRIEQPLDCAGSFKSESLGIALFSRIESNDPTALIGLPLIRLSEWLKPLHNNDVCLLCLAGPINPI